MCRERREGGARSAKGRETHGAKGYTLGSQARRSDASVLWRSWLVGKAPLKEKHASRNHDADDGADGRVAAELVQPEIPRHRAHEGEGESPHEVGRLAPQERSHYREYWALRHRL